MFRDVDGFFAAFAREASINVPIANLNAFNDILRGGFGILTEDGFALRWLNGDVSRKRLGDAAYWQLVNIIQQHVPTAREGRSVQNAVVLILQ